MKDKLEIQPDIQKHLADFNLMIGQKAAIDIIKTAIKAFHYDRARGNPSYADNAIAVGPPGVGKSTICKLLHKAYGFPDNKFYEALGTTLNQETLISTLLTLDSESTLYIDEAMGLNADTKQILLKALEDNVLLLPDTKKNKIHKIPLENFHCCLALTDEHMLENALRQRFQIHLRLQLYCEKELEKILALKANELNIRTTGNDVFEYLADRSRKTARVAIHNLKAAWRVSRSENATALTLSHAKKAMMIGQIYEGGCTIDDINYLAVLKENPHQPTRLNIICSKLSLPKRTLTDVIESWLVQSGLIEKHSSGRVLTEKGLGYISRISYQ